MRLCASLLDKVRLGMNASALIHTFNDLYNHFFCENYLNNFQLFLCAATEHNHTELVKQLLSDTRCDLETWSVCVTRPLFIAIRYGNPALVELFLHSNSSLKLSRQYLTVLPCEDKISDLNFNGFVIINDVYVTISAIEYACLCDQREILKLLVAYDSNQTRHSDQIVDRELSVLYALAERVNPLHDVIAFMCNDQFRRMSTLPALVQLMLDAKIEVNSLCTNGFTALNLLINEVKVLDGKSFFVSAELHSMIVQTASILLTAGSFTSGPVGHNPLDILLDLALKVSPGLRRRSTVSECENSRMISQLIKQLLKHGAMPKNALERKRLFKIILRQIIVCVNNFKDAEDEDDRQTFRIVLDNIASVFNYFALCDCDVMSSFFSCNNAVQSQNELVEGRQDGRLFQLALVYLAGFGSEKDNSSKFIHLFLNCMRPAHINKIKIGLSTATATGGAGGIFKYPGYLNATLELLDGVKIPYTLQDLARGAVTRAMSHGCLNDEDMAALCLPKSLREYILRE